MNLDLATLTLAGALVALIAGGLLAGAWALVARSPALLWWSAANIFSATGIALIAIGTATGMMAVAAFGVGFAVASPALVWAGVRKFSSRPAPVVLLSAGVLAYAVLSLAHSPSLARAGELFGFFSVIAYHAAAIYELWRARAERLRARWALTGMFAIHATVFVGGIVDTLSGELNTRRLPALDSWFGLITFESLLYSIGTAVFMVLLVKERSEGEHIAAGSKDSLTGIANRGALLDGAERLLRRCQQEGSSLSLAMFDLDRFKRVNDTHGHAAGDAVIRRFTAIAQTALRPTDLFGRYGGEEFVLVLPGATIEAAYVIADRIRVAFAAAETWVGGQRLKVTVSAGVASATSATLTTEAIMKIADTGLYRAKELGRNRVERPVKMATQPGVSEIIRVA